LWEEITRDDVINPGEHFRIQERIRALNDLGFSVGDVELASLENGSQLRLRVITTDRYFHKDQIYDLTGLDMEERQARTMMTENMTIAELYCQLLEHKWYLSERAQRDVGHQAAVEDYLGLFGTKPGSSSAK
jgi:hypothetical protein